MIKMTHKNIGSSLDEFLEEEGVLEKTKSTAIKRAKAAIEKVGKIKDYEKPHESYERYLGKDSGGFPVRVVKLARDIRSLRALLFASHDPTYTHSVYGDDGEMQCNTCGIDFRRDSVHEIDHTLTENKLKELMKE